LDFQKNVVFDAKYILVDVNTGLMTGAESINDVAEILVVSGIKEVDVLVPSELVEMRISRNWDDNFVYQSTGVGSIAASICLLANNIRV
jgi:hypothetical protein